MSQLYLINVSNGTNFIKRQVVILICNNVLRRLVGPQVLTLKERPFSKHPEN